MLHVAVIWEQIDFSDFVFPRPNGAGLDAERHGQRQTGHCGQRHFRHTHQHSTLRTAGQYLHQIVKMSGNRMTFLRTEKGRKWICERTRDLNGTV